jgi:hypothetical protein
MPLAVVALVLGAGWQQIAVGQAVYYFNYDANSNGGVIVDESPNSHDLGTFSDASFQFAPLPGSGGPPVVGTARAFDVHNTTNSVSGPAGYRQGGLTDPNPIGSQAISDGGGYTFETWIKRNQNVAPATQGGVAQMVWNPEGLHSIEIQTPNAAEPTGRLQLALRGLASFTVDVNTALPLGQWNHLMAVMDVTDPYDPVDQSMSVTYKLLVNGVQVGQTLGEGDPDMDGVPGINLANSFATFETANGRHGIGWNESGNFNPVDIPLFFVGEGLRGELAYTRLSLGDLTYDQSLAFARNIPGFVPEPSNFLLIGLSSVVFAAFRRRRV